MVNACIIYLVRTSDEDLRDFLVSLRSLYSNFLSQFKYPVLAFVEDSFNEKYRTSVLEEFDFVQFCNIKFTIPSHVNMDNVPKMYPHPTHGNGPYAWGHPGFTLGYRHMCRFFSGEIYHRPEILKYDYYMRLDTDSVIASPIPYDIFQHFKDNTFYYGFPKIDKDHPKVVEGLWEATREFAKSKNINKELGHYLGMYYTNFEIGYIPWFLNSGYMDYYNYLDKSGGFFTKRWGDAPVKFLGVNLLMDSKHIHHVSCFNYKHGTVKEIDSTFKYSK